MRKRSGETATPSRTRRTGMVGSVVCAMVVVVASCASVKTSPGTGTAQFFQNPDRVWIGLEETLETLGYTTSYFNRADGVIRTEPRVEDDLPAIALEINQIANTEDQVKIYVKPVPGDPSNPPSQEALDKAAADVITVLKRKLGG